MCGGGDQEAGHYLLDKVHSVSALHLSLNDPPVAAHDVGIYGGADLNVAVILQGAAIPRHL